MNLLYKLWSDEGGAASPASAILMTTVVAIGSVVGLVAIRDHVVQQLGDLAVALDNVDQSYSVDFRRDLNDDGDYDDDCEFRLVGGYGDTPTLADPPDASPAGIDLTVAASDEGS
jgi:hypothetical protein